MIDGAGNLVAWSNPSLALTLNPLRSDARVAVAIGEIDTEPVRGLIRTGLALSPIDARFYSLLGVLADKDDDQDTASKYYRYALGLSSTEIQALSRQLLIDVSRGDYLDAANRLEVLGRRWPGRWSSIEPILPVLLSDPTAYTQIAERFGAYTPLRNLLISSFTRDPQNVAFAYKLVLDWHNQDRPNLGEAINAVTGSFLRDKQYAAAHLLFQLTRPPETNTGYVYNNTFSMPFSGNPFDWRVRNQAGVSFDQVKRDGASALSIRFLDNPIQFRNVSELVRLLPGSYEGTISYEGRDLVMPKPIQVGIRCLPSNAIVQSVALKEGSSEQDATLTFTVPVAGCALQEVFLYNDKLPMSWRNRYRGTLLLKSVSFKRGSGT